jgi:hypothetical protein
MKNDLLIKSKLDEAESRLALAEGDLEAAMGALLPTPRAQKTIAGQVLEEAFAKLRATRAEVKRLANLVETDEADKPAEPSADTSADASADASANASADTPADAPAATSADTPAATPTDKPAE